ncbi:MlaD family protein [Mycobacteroides abscessus]|uniref:MlaD family protein n=1 Tax=Mycobacteroides abscessus TaxID=36809 RepID=UPI0009277BDE|nr:MlaD family protein [Mycobacteroides abscessus]SHU86948.1 Mce family protein [Mycobacteroides abscessus subsp. bolletii]SHW22106.1 Mce family protein [Mycobacteroides abscessus subsp. bolletii]SHW47543.1 Mce family protein [Mycobacteroides abscessus subsp. bolletii]SHX91943.1 Mce family protein [Mycobacteroides abscessus subsp. bolletii]SKS69268.1 Mce family protein [Mycobacteroides abscessus subsp. bolletii]
MIRNIISICALLALLLGSAVLIGQQGVPWLTSDDGLQRVSLRVRDSAGLIQDSRVLLRGVPIGKVTAVNSDADGVAVEFEYPSTVRVPVDSEFRIENLSALGETYLSIKPAMEGGAYLADGQQLTAEPGTVAGTIGEAAVALTQLLSGLNPDLVHEIVEELNTALSDDSAAPVLGNASRNFQTLVTTRKDDLRDILALTQNLLDKRDVVAPSLKDFQRVAPNFFGNLQTVVEGAIVLIYQTGKYPDDVKNGAGQVIGRLHQFVTDIGPDLYNLTEPLLPPLQATAAALTTFDTSRLLDSAIDSVSTPGAFTVHVVQSR